MFREKCKLEAPHGARAGLHHLIVGDGGVRQHMCEKVGREPNMFLVRNLRC